VGTRTFLSALVVALSLGACASPRSAEAKPAEPRPLAAVLRELRDVDGGAHDATEAARQGKSIVLVFWQAWCVACRREAPEIVAAAASRSATHAFFGVVPGPDDLVDEKELRAAIAANGFLFPQIRDRDLALTHAFGVGTTPAIVVLDERLEVLHRGPRPPRDWTKGWTKGEDAREAATSTEPVVRTFDGGVMGTDLRIQVEGRSAAELDRAIEEAIAEVRRVEDLMTDWRASPLSTLNDSAGGGPVAVPVELAALVARSLEMAELTGGAFDPTFASAGKLWDFKREPPVVPGDAEIAEALAHVGHARVEVDPELSTVALPAGTRLGLGGIAKGYGVDRALDVLRRHGIANAIVKAGGDMKVLGLERGKPWEIAIKHPRDRERALAVLKVSNVCVSTSGDYERFFEIDGRRYHHILDPRTGKPSEGCIAATVVAPNSEYADALATALCVLGPEAGLELVERLPRVEAIVVAMDGSVSASSGLRDSLLPFAARDVDR
jgi:thiamine biosynthesis lipoprotein